MLDSSTSPTLDLTISSKPQKKDQKVGISLESTTKPKSLSLTKAFKQRRNFHNFHASKL
jgi:hypothetical protein